MNKTEDKNVKNQIKNKMFLGIIILIVSIIVLYLFSQDNRNFISEGYIKEGLPSNGWYAKNGGIEVISEGGIIKVNDLIKGENREINELVFYLNVTDSGIIYENIEDGNRLYQLSFDGEEKSVLVDDEVTNVLAHDDWIYYSSYTDDNKIFRVDKKGNNKTLISDKGSINFFIDNNKIYYSLLEGGLIKADMDGSNKEHLSDGDLYRVYKEGNKVYHLDSKVGTGKLYSLNLETGEKELIIDDKAESYIVNNGFLYYSTDFEANNIGFFRVNLETREIEKVSDFNAFGFYIKDNIVYMTRYFDNKKAAYDIDKEEMITEEPDINI